MHCLLVGNYGTDNLGDEALRDYFTGTFGNVEWQVLSANPQQSNELPRLPGGFRSFFATPWFKTVAAIGNCDAVVFGGGSLFTDVESVYACYLWFLHAFVARLFRKPVILASQGMGPYKTRTGEWCARWVARHSAFISVRDEESAKRVASWGLGHKCVQTFDPVFLAMGKYKSKISSKNVFVVIPRHNSSSTLQSEAQKYVSGKYSGSLVHILLMQPNDVGEQGIANALSTALPGSVVIPVRTLDELMSEVTAADFVLTQRFHGALASLAVGVPTHILPQGAGDKLSTLVRFTGDARDDVDEMSQRALNGESTLRETLAKLAK